MEFIDLKPLSIPRLKAYRKSILAKMSGFTHCWCGAGCYHQIELANANPNYQNLKLVIDRVNKELARKQTAEREAAKNPAHVYTHAEEKRRKNKVTRR